MNNFCKNLKKLQSDENVNLKGKLSQENIRESILCKQNDRNLFLAIIKWKILNENYSEFFFENIYPQNIGKTKV